MFIPDPGSWFLPIPDPGSKNSNKRQGWKKICCHNFLCSHKFHKIANYFSFEVLKKKIWANFQRFIELFTQKIVNKLSKIWVWDPGSGKNLFHILDPGVKKAPDPGSGSATLCTTYLGGKLYPTRPRLNVKFVAMSLGVAEARSFCQSKQKNET